jgi:NADH-ubiquinone oxidoreductase chain 5
MEGPTPVSALIHAATMVTAGVFLIIRSSPLLESSPFTLTLITIVGALTALFGASVSLVQNDIKKVIAYSTCSQLGYMVMICGISCYSVSLFHLVNHAFFKGLLFLSSGSVIHALSDEQDLRKMGALIKYLPFTYVMFLIGSLSIIGFPYLSGYYSKDLLMELLYEKYCIVFSYLLGSLTVLLTSFYSVRMLYLTFMTNSNTPKMIYNRVVDCNALLMLPLVLLGGGSIFVGFAVQDMIIFNVLKPYLTYLVVLGPIIISCLGALGGVIVYDRALIKSVEFE